VFTFRYAPQQLSTFALNLYRYRTKRGERSVLIDFWDTAGQERFNSMHR
jgi:Rab-like protein 2